MPSPPSLSYWGKADPAYAGDPKWHPLAYHCLDVAAVGVEFLQRAPVSRQLFAGYLDGEVGLDGWVAFWPALHGLGKLFQTQRPNVSQVTLGAE